jgi:putative transposase
MPRRARIAVPGIPWHIIQRGNNRNACFFGEADYRYSLETLAEQAGRYGCAVHAYALMTNHVHLLLTPEEKNSAALLMKHLGQRYAQYINRRHRRSGSLWEGRFRSCLAQNERYVLTCYRYIELNPVRAGMVAHPREYRWSSYRTNAEDLRDPLITPHPDYLRLAPDELQRQAAYTSLFSARLKPDILHEIRHATNGNYVLGDNQFKEEIATTLKRRVSPGKSGRPAKRRSESG